MTVDRSGAGRERPRRALPHRALADLRMLGPVSVSSSDGAPVLTGKVAELMARLAMAGGEPMLRRHLLEDIWPDGSGHPGPLRVAVSRARNVFGPAVIVTEGSSYRIGPVTSDVQRFEQGLAAGRSLALSPDDRLAAYERGLAEWSVSSTRPVAFLDGIDSRAWVRAERTRLGALREAAVDERAELLLAVGEHRRVLSELLIEAWGAPTREHRAWLLALAFYRCGQQADALSMLSTWARRLRSEFGLEPGPALRDLEQRILHHDQSLDLPGALGRPDDRVHDRRGERKPGSGPARCTDVRAARRRQRRAP